jgi:Ca2+-binding EF-hand superfamily protein
MEPPSLGAYAYFLFDDDGGGSLDHDEVKKLVETIQHKSYDKTPAVRKLVENIMTGQSKVSVEHFAKCSKENQSLCAPLISLQHEIRSSFLGKTP